MGKKQGEAMISLIEQQIEPVKKQQTVRQRVVDYLATGKPLDHAPKSILTDVDRLYEMLERARSLGVTGISLSRELQSVARARAFGKAIAPLTESV